MHVFPFISLSVAVYYGLSQGIFKFPLVASQIRCFFSNMLFSLHAVVEMECAGRETLPPVL